MSAGQVAKAGRLVAEGKVHVDPHVTAPAFSAMVDSSDPRAPEGTSYHVSHSPLLGGWRCECVWWRMRRVWCAHIHAALAWLDHEGHDLTTFVEEDK